MAKPEVKKTAQAVARPVARPQAVTTARSQGVATQEEVPDYIKRGQGRGSEAVGTEDLVIPRLEIAQALSPCLDKNHAAFIEDCGQGDIYNSVTREVYGPKVRVVPVLFQKNWLVWRDRAKGGGFAGAHPTSEQADARIEEQEKPDEYQSVETAQQYVLVLRDDDTFEQAVVSMAKTKLKVSRNWNSLIRMNGGDRFARYYVLMTVQEKNAMNQAYFNFGVLPGKWSPQMAYEEGERIYTGLTAGTIKVKIDDKFDETNTDAEAGGKEY